MKFTKYFVAGKDYILINDNDSIKSAEKIGQLCNRIKGIGADAVISSTKTAPKTRRTTIFNNEHTLSEDHSSAAICAYYATTKATDYSVHTFINSKNELVTVRRKSDSPYIFHCNMHSVTPTEIFNCVNRKTEIGNRILTITPVYILDCFAIHFSSDKDKLGIMYLGQNISVNSLFQKQANLILAERTEKNSYKISFYENKTGCPRPTIAALASTALAACKNGYSNYNENINVSCDGVSVNATCTSDENITVECRAEKIFTGNLVQENTSAHSFYDIAL